MGEFRLEKVTLIIILIFVNRHMRSGSYPDIPPLSRVAEKDQIMVAVWL